MKKILSLTLAVLLVAAMLLTLASCGPTFNGKFQDTTASTVFQFSSNKVVVTMDKGIEDLVIRGKYEIVENEDGTTEITFDFGEDADKAGRWQGTMKLVRAIDRETDRRYIILDNYKFTEVYQ